MKYLAVALSFFCFALSLAAQAENGLVNYYCITRFSKETIWIDGQKLAVGKKYLPGLMEKLRGPTGSI